TRGFRRPDGRRKLHRGHAAQAHGHSLRGERLGGRRHRRPRNIRGIRGGGGRFGPAGRPAGLRGRLGRVRDAIRRGPRENC
ncbi:hypothetical protein THAOC_17924, partial [Thalassiosira oceanica]